MNKFPSVVLTTLFLAACVSAPSGAQKAPAWITGAPSPDAKYTYFTAEATDASGDRSLAADAAVNAIVATVVKYLGVEVKAEFEGEALATLDSYRASMKQSVSLSADARFAGFSVAETFYAPSRERKSKAVTAYVLAKYETAEMEKERARLQALIDEQNDLVLAPERDGGTASAEGRALDAARFFLQAAAGAASLDIDNRDVKVRRNLDKALNAIVPLRLVRASSPERVGLNRPAPEPFVVKALHGGDSGSPVPGAKLAVAYQRKQASGRLVGKTESVVTDRSGLASFMPPSFDFLGASKLAFSVESGAMREYLDAMPTAFEAQTEAIRRELGAKSLEIPFVIGSDAKAVPVHIAIIDQDESGGAGGSIAQRAALDEFLAQEFAARVFVAPAEALMTGRDGAVLAAAKAASASRAVYGKAVIASVKKDGGAWIANCVISLNAADVATGLPIAGSERTINAVGASESAARQAAWKAAGTAAAKDILSKLP